MAESNSLKSSEAIEKPSSESKNAQVALEAQEAPASAHDPSVFPEGGEKAWLTVAGAAACLFTSFGWVNCVGIFEEYYQENQLKEYSHAQIAWIPALQIFFMFFAGLMVGKIYDDHGPSLLLLFGTFLHVFGLMLTSTGTTYVQIILSQSVCSGIGASMVFYPAVNCVSTWFRAKRGAALGLVAAGASLGGVVFPTMVIQLIPSVGFGWAMRICAFLILALLIFANFSVRSRLPPNKRPFHPMAFIRPLTEPTFAFVTAAIFFFYWGMFIPIIFIVSIARSHGMSENMSNYLVPILNATSIIGRTVPNALADKVGHINMMIVTAILTTVMILGPLMTAANDAAIIAFAAIFGISSGAGVGLAPVIIAHISPIQDIGIRTGTAFAVGAFAVLSGGPIGGQLVTISDGDFKNTVLFGGVSCAIGTGFFILARISRGGLKFTKV